MQSGSQGFKTKDATSYDPVIDNFDRFTERLTSPLAEKMVALADIEGNQRVLDIGTGTGVVARCAAGKLTPPGSVLGIDLSESMLKTAKQRSTQMGLSDRIQFQKMDAEALDIGDGTMDKVISLFALMHFPNPDAALNEMYRVLRPGGMLLMGVGSGPPLHSVSGWLHRLGRLREIPSRLTGRLLSAPQFLDQVVERHIPPAPEPEEAALPRSTKNRSTAVPELTRNAGFQIMKTHWIGFVASIDRAEDFWELQKTFSSFSRKRIQSASESQVEKVKQEFMLKSNQVLDRGGQLIYPYAAFLTAARRAP